MDGPEAQLTSADDRFHAVGDSPWETETSWFSFYYPPAGLTGYVYGFIRRNLGICAGGVILWDGRSFLPWEVLHYDYQWHLPLPDSASGWEDLPTGVQIETLQALHSYRIGYRSRRVELDLTFEAVTHPFVPQIGEPPFMAARHLDQPGRVRGTVLLGDRRMDIDCFAMRDRSWGPRDDRRVGRFGYTYATASPALGFLAYARPVSDETAGIFAGYLLRDGVRSPLVTGNRTVARHPDHGGPETVHVTAKDQLGRELVASGTAVNRLCFTPYPQMLNWTTTLDWEIDGVDALGEDQDVWSRNKWAEARRAVQVNAGAGDGS